MSTKPVKVSELQGDALDWAVATIKGYTELHRMENRWDHEPHFAMHPPRREYGVVEMWQLGFSTDWSQGGPIIERERIGIKYTGTAMGFVAWLNGKLSTEHDCYGPTPLIAAMRCFVASCLGDEVNIPEELK